MININITSPHLQGHFLNFIYQLASIHQLKKKWEQIALNIDLILCYYFLVKKERNIKKKQKAIILQM